MFLVGGDLVWENNRGVFLALDGHRFSHDFEKLAHRGVENGFGL